MKYEYAEGDLLAHPQKYQYTAYFGIPFINAWNAQRQHILMKLPFPALLDLNAGAVGTGGDLTAACLAGRSGRTKSSDIDKLLFYIKKFEVSKRLYMHYSTEGKAIRTRESYTTLLNYLLLAECCTQQWQVNHAAYWLSALLKINDTLSTQIARLEHEEKAYFAWILRKEDELLKLLQRELT